MYKPTFELFDMPYDIANAVVNAASIIDKIKNKKHASYHETSFLK